MTPEEQLSLDALRAALPPICDDGRDCGGFAVAYDQPVCIDCEWTEETGVLTTIGVGNETHVCHVPWPGRDPDGTRRWLERLVRETPVVYHHAVADIKKLREHGFDVHPASHYALDDTMLAHAVLHSEEEHTLEYLCERYGKLPPHKHLRKVPEAAREYNAADVVETVLIWKHGLAPELARDPAADAVYREQSLAFLAEIQIETEEAGIRVDKTQPWPLHDKFGAKREQATKVAQAYLGWPVNLNSPDDMKHALYVVEGLPVQYGKRSLTGGGSEGGSRGGKRTGHGSAHARLAANARGDVPSTDKDAIAALRRLQGTEWDADEAPTLERAWANIAAGGHPLLEARYLFMGAQQALSHYVMPCFEVDDKDAIVGIRDRLYPEIRQHVQATGRHSFVRPALQQYKGELAALITPDPGHVWVGHDWSNIETWLLGYLANDPGILRAKREGWDTHTVNFCDITTTPYPPILTKALHTAPECAAWRAAIGWTGDEDTRRTFAKRYVYRLHYRGQPANAGDIPGAKALGFNTERLVDASVRYLLRHEPIVEFWRRVEAQAERHRVVYTFMGRPRRLTSKFRNARNREASNHPMQGGVADIYVTTALCVKRAAPWARFVYGAHDSQWWQVPAGRKEEFQALYRPIVTRPFEINGREADFPASFKERAAAGFFQG